MCSLLCPSQLTQFPYCTLGGTDHTKDAAHHKAEKNKIEGQEKVGRFKHGILAQY